MSETPIYALFERLANLIRAEERQVGTENGLQPVHLYALYYLSRCNRYSDTPAAVTEYLGMTKGTVSQTLQVLEKKGLILKQGDSEDKRLVHLHLTEQGKRMIKSLTPPPSFRKAMQQLSATDSRQIEQQFIRLLTVLQQNSMSRTFGECQTCRHFQNNGTKYQCGLTQQELKVAEITRICREHSG